MIKTRAELLADLEALRAGIEQLILSCPNVSADLQVGRALDVLELARLDIAASRYRRASRLLGRVKEIVAGAAGGQA